MFNKRRAATARVASARLVICAHDGAINGGGGGRLGEAPDGDEAGGVICASDGVINGGGGGRLGEAPDGNEKPKWLRMCCVFCWLWLVSCIYIHIQVVGYTCTAG